MESGIKKRCAFCSYTGKLTKEHRFPEWLQKYLPLQFDRTAHVVTRPMSPDRQIHRVETGPMAKTGDPLSRRLKVVCGRCNHGWMSRLQTIAEPILTPLILGTWGPLSVADKTTLAAWMTMTTMVNEYFDPEMQSIPREQREAFATSMVPANCWYIGIAPYSDSQTGAVAVHSSVDLYPTAEKRREDAELSQVTCFALGRVMLHSLGGTTVEGFARNVDLRTYAKRLQLYTIWPAQEDSLSESPVEPPSRSCADLWKIAAPPKMYADDPMVGIRRPRRPLE